jgi:NAD(P)-dependent dehydrogenase (short-subunit alcohol dehydrogenase family)
MATVMAFNHPKGVAMNTQTIEDQVDLTGKAAIVTGGAGGIGQVIAIALAEYGAAVMIVDRDRDTANETASIIREKGGQALAIGTDLDEHDADVVVETTVKCFGRLDILVNAASEFSFSPLLAEIDGLWARTLRSHVDRVARYCQAAAEEMFEQGHGGRIINIASMDAMRPATPRDGGDPGKMSIAFLSKKLAVELAPNGITVNALAPSIVQRPDGRLQAVNLYRTAKGAPQNPSSSQLPGSPPQQDSGAEDVATVVLFLVSPSGAQVTGNLVSMG